MRFENFFFLSLGLDNAAEKIVIELYLCMMYTGCSKIVGTISENGFIGQHRKKTKYDIF